MSEKESKRDHHRPDHTDEPLEVKERIRNQWEVLGVARHVLERLDHSVRYGLIIFSAVNTGAVILIVRPHLFATIGPTVASVMRVLAVFYIAVAVWILLQAVRSLSPHLSPAELRSLSPRADQKAAGADPLLLITMRPIAWEPSTLAIFHEAWREVSGEELSRELSEGILISQRMIDKKNAVLNRLYPGLAVMLLLAAALIVAMGFSAA